MGDEKLALVLSAGGMFGAYQAGAYRAIAKIAEPDLVVGASVGALNGWPIAGGCSPDELIGRWLDPKAGTAMTLFPKAGWRNGWFDPAPLQALTEDIAGTYTPRKPFGLVMVQVPAMRAVLVRHPDITAHHLRATCSIPLFLPTVKIGKNLFMDGGFFEKLPIYAALEMGATRVIAIDSLPDVGLWWLRAGIDFVRMFKPTRRYPAHLDLTVVSPSEPLGSVNDAIRWKRENIERWVALGERDATSALTAFPLGRAA